MKSRDTATGPASAPGAARRLSLWAVVLAAAVFAFVPVAFDPTDVVLYTPAAFYLPKFELLMGLSAALLAAVAGATLLGARFVKVPVVIPALAFLGVSALSTLLSGDVVHSLVGRENRYDGLLTLAAGVLLFYAAARFLDSWAKVRVFLVAGVTSAVLISVYGIVQHFGLDPVPDWGIPWYSGARAFSTLGWGLWLAAYLTLMLGAALALYFRTEARWERGLWLAAMAVMAAAWLYTYSRGPVLGVAVALPVVLWLARRRLGGVKPLLVPLAVVAVAVVSAHLVSPHSSTALGRFDSANVAMSPEEKPQGGDASVSTRLLMWRDTLPVIAERPVLGHGPDNFAGPFARHEGEDLRAFFGERVVDKAHNEFLQVAATTGLLGLGAYLWVFVAYFRHAYRSGGWGVLALSGGVLAYILQLQTAFTTIGTGVTFWAVLGVTVAMMRLRKQQGDSADSLPSHHDG